MEYYVKYADDHVYWITLYLNIYIDAEEGVAGEIRRLYVEMDERLKQTVKEQTEKENTF